MPDLLRSALNNSKIYKFNFLFSCKISSDAVQSTLLLFSFTLPQTCNKTPIIVHIQGQVKDFESGVWQRPTAP